MPERCDKCGTELDPEQDRHHRYEAESPDTDEEPMTGRLCSGCFYDFREWLDTKAVTPGE